jgi:hypothetical protein
MMVPTRVEERAMVWLVNMTIVKLGMRSYGKLCCRSSVSLNHAAFILRGENYDYLHWAGQKLW